LVLKVIILHFVAHLLYTLSRISSSIELFGGQAICGTYEQPSRNAGA